MSKKINYGLTGLIICFALCYLTVGLSAPAKELDLKDTRVIMIIASQMFKDEEYQVTRDVLEQAGAKVVVACSISGTARSASGNLQVPPDLTIDKVNVKEYDAVIFIGGPGAQEYFANRIAFQIAKGAVENNKILAAICIAPIILANAGILKDRKATGWKSIENDLKSRGVLFTDKPVVQDGRIITANGPSASEEFAQTIAQALYEAKSIKSKPTPAIIHCDLKMIKNVCKCESCNKLFSDWWCPNGKCDYGLQRVQFADAKRIEIRENETIIIPIKCPKCGERISSFPMQDISKCPFCRKSFSKQIPFCVKYVYACPEHTACESFKLGLCPVVITDDKGKEKKCDKKLELSRMAYSPIVYVYECPKCKDRTDKPGKCETCKQAMVKKKTCKDSGAFPHVNEIEWEKGHQK